MHLSALSPDIPPPSAVQRAYTHVADAIISGGLAASSLVTEGEVAARLGMSRTPVREAFLSLEAHGLIRLFPKKGAIVTAIDDEEVADLLQVRIMLETTAVQLLSDRADGGAAHDMLQPLILAQSEAAASGDLLSFALTDHRFHAGVVHQANNRIIESIYAQLGPRLERLTHRVVSRDRSNLDRLLAEHRTLAGHLESGDIRAYEIALRAHVAER